MPMFQPYIAVVKSAIFVISHPVHTIPGLSRLVDKKIPIAIQNCIMLIIPNSFFFLFCFCMG